jgi:uncharacterized protein (DUF58 family)
VTVRPEPRLAALLGLAVLPLLAAPAFPDLVTVVLLVDAAIVLAAALDAWLAARPAEVEVERVVHDRLSLGAENLVRLRARSFSARPARIRLRDDAPPEMGGPPPAWLPLALAPRGEAEARYHLSPRRRGDYRFGPVFLRSLGPLGLLHLERAIEADREVRVYPNLIGIERWKLGLRRQRVAEMGLHVIRKRGSGTEFEKLKPYAQGDEFRHVDWKATARRRAPVTRVFETERSQTVMVLIDAGRQMSTWVQDLSRLDYAVNAALMLAYVASTRDDKVGLAVFADEVESYLEPKKGAKQYRRMMEALYRVEAEPIYTDYIGAIRELARRQRKRALVVVFTDIVDAEALRDLHRALALLRRKHLALVVALRDPSFAEVARGTPASVDGVYEKVVAREVLEERSRAIRAIVRRGAHVLDIAPQDFSTGVVSKYLELKARGLL